MSVQMTHAYEVPEVRFPEAAATEAELAGLWATASRGRTRHWLAAVLVPLVFMGGDVLSFAVPWVALSAAGLVDALTDRMMLAMAVFAVAMLWTAGLYPGRFVHGAEILRRRVLANLRTGVAAAGAAALFVSWPLAAEAALIAAAALVLQPMLRTALRALLDRGGMWRQRAVFIGPKDLESSISQHLSRHGFVGLSCDPTHPAAGRDARIALVAAPYPDEATLDDLRARFDQTILLADLPCLPRSGLDPADIRGEIGLRLNRRPTDRRGTPLERALDIPLALSAILFAAPIMLGAALAIYLIDPGPVVFRQSREGYVGRRFRLIKLRTMYQDADTRLEELLARDPAARAEWETHYKLKKDPRVLPVIGGFLRSTSIDELPQFFNVLAGEMRIVGPRPFPHYHLAALDQGCRARRGSVAPGLTGLWQVSERSGATIERQQRLDDYYIDNRSFWFDLNILIGTVRAVLRRSGAY